MNSIGRAHPLHSQAGGQERGKNAGASMHHVQHNVMAPLPADRLEGTDLSHCTRLSILCFADWNKLA